jgi:hypothetical protein
MKDFAKPCGPMKQNKTLQPEGIRFPVELWKDCEVFFHMGNNMVKYMPKEDMYFLNAKALANYMHKTHRDWEGDLFPILSFLLGLT